MSAIENISGTGIPLVGDDIDTDRIIPARFLRCVTFEGLGESVFADDRQQANGQHPFDLPQYQGAKILVVNANFGCGSSREHAPQAIIKWGINAIVGVSFAEIFFGNCLANGVPCVSVALDEAKRLQELIQANPQASISVDLASLQVSCGDYSAPIAIDEGARQMLRSGSWDSCGQLIQNTEQIKAKAAQLPYLSWATSN
jgi:3-isopropylmalate/(R)-2-methylmalate dehydratase small subunit